MSRHALLVMPRTLVMLHTVHTLRPAETAALAGAATSALPSSPASRATRTDLVVPIALSVLVTRPRAPGAAALSP
eukprot:3696783-Alexandrium_andersonii.AAC.1